MRIMFILFFMLLNVNVFSKEMDVRTYIPPKAFQYIPIIKEETEKIFPDFILPSYFASLIEHESCISLSHSRCWSPKSRLKTSREEGAGLSQLTRAYRNDGSVRFDTLTELSKRYKYELKELTWDTVYYRPDLQIKAMILITKTNYNNLFFINNWFERLKMADSVYNGGMNSLVKDRTTCGLAKDCDPQIWKFNVEKYCSKSKKILYGNRNACDINRNHVYETTNLRLKKYYLAFKES